MSAFSTVTASGIADGPKHALVSRSVNLTKVPCEPNTNYICAALSAHGILKRGGKNLSSSGSINCGEGFGLNPTAPR
jgi:hypothetical protein